MKKRCELAGQLSDDSGLRVEDETEGPWPKTVQSFLPTGEYAEGAFCTLPKNRLYATLSPFFSKCLLRMVDQDNQFFTESEAYIQEAATGANRPYCDRLSFIEQLNVLMKDPENRVVFFARHAHAVQENKKHPTKDKFRPLDAKGVRDAENLGFLLADLAYGNVVMLTSSATRTLETAKAIRRAIKKSSSIELVSGDQFYHVPVKYYFRFLRTNESMFTKTHAFIVGHNSAMTKVFLKITGRPSAFIPTAGVMALVVKAPDWESFYTQSHEKVHVFTWSPRGTEVLESVCTDGDSEFSYFNVSGACLELPE